MVNVIGIGHDCYFSDSTANLFNVGLKWYLLIFQNVIYLAQSVGCYFGTHGCFFLLIFALYHIL